jgi:hypothetical protein
LKSATGSTFRFLRARARDPAVRRADRSSDDTMANSPSRSLAEMSLERSLKPS